MRTRCSSSSAEIRARQKRRLVAPFFWPAEIGRSIQGERSTYPYDDGPLRSRRGCRRAVPGSNSRSPRARRPCASIRCARSRRECRRGPVPRRATSPSALFARGDASRARATAPAAPAPCARYRAPTSLARRCARPRTPGCAAGKRQQRSRVAHVELVREQQLLHRLARVASAAADCSPRCASGRPRCGGVVRQLELVDQARDALRLLERIEILALDVLDQRQARAPPDPERCAPAPERS